MTVIKVRLVSRLIPLLGVGILSLLLNRENPLMSVLCKFNIPPDFSYSDERTFRTEREIR